MNKHGPVMKKSYSSSRPLILASASPRRCQLMRQAGYDFEVIPSVFDEPAAPESQAHAAAWWAEALAYMKASQVAQTNPQAIVIGADTIVTHSGCVVGKPRDLADARRILSTMFGGRNEVITGLAVLCPALNKRVITHVTTTLIMRPMDSGDLEQYLAGGAWRDKAGAYALQEGGDKFVESIEGSESNVVGLPMEKLAEVLAEFCD
jgi:septum formation protein